MPVCILGSIHSCLKIWSLYVSHYGGEWGKEEEGGLFFLEGKGNNATNYNLIYNLQSLTNFSQVIDCSRPKICLLKHLKMTRCFDLAFSLRPFSHKTFSVFKIFRKNSTGIRNIDRFLFWREKSNLGKVIFLPPSATTFKV